MTILDPVIEWLSSLNQPSVERREVDGDFVSEAVNDYLDEHAKDGTRLPLDGKYYVASKDDMDAIVSANHDDKRIYRKAKYDCENFALTFMSSVQREYGLTNVGLVIDWSGAHAYNMFVYDDGTVELYEPQDDDFVEPGDAEKYAFENVKVII